MDETRALARFVVDTQFTHLPTGLVDECKMVVLDTIGAGFLGSVQPWSRMVIDMVRELGGTAEATVLNQSWFTDASRAALANGTMIGAFECEPTTASHASGTVIPAVLAIGQREGMSGRECLTALALGFEVSARMARSAAGQETLRGFHSPGTQGPLAAAAAVGKLYGFDADMVARAMGIAGSSSAGLLEFEWTGADTKRIHLGRASQLGLESALLARKGFNGPRTVLEGRAGYYNAFAQPHDLRALVDGLGTRWTMRPPSLKSYPAHVTHQSVVHAIQAFKETHYANPADVTRVVIRGTPRMVESRHGTRDPDSVMGAQYSLPFTTAVALSRNLDDPLAYDEATIRDPVVRALAMRVELIPVEFMKQAGADPFHAEVAIECAGETHTLTTRPSRGSPQNPFTWDDVCRKFHRSTATLIDRAKAAAIVETVGELEQVGDVATLARHLAG